ncbi:MAG TPA: hypothetical protein VJG48_01730 [Candidatus Paceibacterota bacterium]
MSDSKAKNQFANVAHSRTEEQKQVMEDILAKGHCPFCPEQLEAYHKEPLLKDGKFWILTKNQWPYEGAKLHLLAIAKKHAAKLCDLEEGSGNELLDLLTWAEKEFEIPGGSFFIRFGDTDYTGATVQHIHAQLISSEPRLDEGGKENDKLKVKLGYKKLS